MSRILFVGQEKEGVGKTLFCRALAEGVVGAPVIEIDASRRMLELGSRVTFYKMRADREAIERTGGRAARAEFDPVLEALSSAKEPTIVDVGANTSASLFKVLSDAAGDLTELGCEFGVCIVVTNEAGALAEAPNLLTLAKPWAKGRFIIENRFHGSVDPAWLKKISDGAKVSVFDHQALEDGAEEYLQGGGLAMITKLDPAKLRGKHGIGPAARIRKDLERFRLEAMRAVRTAAEWMVG
jgi:hypothetical protein